MYTFIFVANPEDQSPIDLLKSCSKTMKKWMPSLGLELVEGHTFLPESNCGWAWLKPACLESFPLMSEAIEEKIAVFLFGDILDIGLHRPAQKVLDVWESSGVKGVRALEGCFSAVIVERTSNKVTLISDPVGHRTLRYCTIGQTLIASPHDSPLVATGYITTEIDDVTAYSIAVVGWSLRGKSLLKHIRTCHPAEYVQWSNDKLQVILDPIIKPSERISAGNSSAILSHHERMLKAAQAYVKLLAGNELKISLSLTAGLDSRAVLGLLLSVIDPTKIVAHTRGDSASIDVQIAQKLAKIHGVDFSPRPSAALTADEFLAYCDWFTFSMNGDVSSKYVVNLSPMPLEPNFLPSLDGLGGEIFRGYYYPNKTTLKTHLSLDNALQILKIKRLKNTPSWISSDMLDAVKARLNTVVNEYAAFSKNGYDILDLFYLYERFSVWGAKGKRTTWNTCQGGPFHSRELIRLAYLFPAPIGQHIRIHQEFIRRFIPQAYWIPVNGRTLLPVPSSEPIFRIYQKAARLIKISLKKVGIRSRNKGINQIQSNILGTPLIGTVSDVLLASNSLVLEIFSKDGLYSLLKNHQPKNTDLVGRLISIERYQTMMQQIAQEARKPL